MEPPAPVPVVERATGQFPRLSHAEWELTVVDLLHLDAPTGLSASFTPDPLGGKAFDNHRSVLLVSPGQFLEYQSAAEAVADQVTRDPTLLSRIVPADSFPDADVKARAFLAVFGLHAFRRPLTADELRARLALFAEGALLYPSLDPFVAGVRLSVAAFLQSPHFLYRTELKQDPAAEPALPLDDFQFASRLSYAVWNSMPDEELFRAASAGELTTPAGLHAQASRLLQSPRAVAAARRFFDQLYDGDQYQTLSTLHFGFADEVEIDLRTELGKFTADVFEQGGGVRELLTSTTTFLSPRIAPMYAFPPEGLTDPDAEGFSRVQLEPSERSGLLTRIGFLAWKGRSSAPNTIQRGAFIARRIICQPLPEPPPAARTATFGSQPTNRARVEALTGPGTCGGGCHGAYLNPAGFAFERYDAIGEYRNFDNDVPIDSSATFPFAEGKVAFTDAISFSAALAGSSQVHACFSGYLFEYLVGRERTPADDPLVAQLAQRSLSGASMRELMAQVIESDALRYPQTLTEAP